MNDLEKVFTDIYNNFGWHMGDGESRSGYGSSNQYTNNFKKDLIHLLNDLNINTVLDCSCGDWNWMKTISNHFKNYVGLDIVEPLILKNQKEFSNERISFVHSEMFDYLKRLKEKSFDLIIIRHTLEHITLQHSLNIIKESMRVSNYMFITSYSENIKNIELDFPKQTYRPINLLNSPFIELLGEPILDLKDAPDNHQVNYSKILLYCNKELK